MIIVNDRPCNGVDLSHWNPDPTDLINQEWLEFFGHKAVHVGGKSMVKGVDPKFEVRRKLAQQLGIRWRAFYMWVVPPITARPAVQVELLAHTMGDLLDGESVYLDWEEAAVTQATISEIATYMNLEFGDRWFMYANDSTPDMVSWMQSNKNSGSVPLMHPNYSLDQGLNEAKKWDATVWQVGTGIPPGFAGEVPLDYVLKPELLDSICY